MLCLLDCNRNKGSDFGSFDPETDKFVILYNRRQDKWSDYFELDSASIIARTSKGRVTEFLLKLNAPKRLNNRELLVKSGRYPPANYDNA